MRQLRNLLVVGVMAFVALSCGTRVKDTPIRFANYNMRELMAVDTADRAFYNRLPAFFSGDFNTTVSSNEIAILFDNDIVKDSYTSSVTPPTGRVSSYYGFDFDRLDGDSRIDYIFVPKDATVHSYACIDDDIRERQYSSDHCPLLVVVSL